MIYTKRIQDSLINDLEKKKKAVKIMIILIDQ